jgi:hypothetical protein
LGGINIGRDAFGVTLEPNGIRVHVGFSCGSVYRKSDAILTLKTSGFTPKKRGVNTVHPSL